MSGSNLNKTSHFLYDLHALITSHFHLTTTLNMSTYGQKCVKFLNYNENYMFLSIWYKKKCNQFSIQIILEDLDF